MNAGKKPYQPPKLELQANFCVVVTGSNGVVLPIDLLEPIQGDEP
jgi:hypothetical protein